MGNPWPASSGHVKSNRCGIKWQKNVMLIISVVVIHSSLNPVLYAFLDENFKRCFREFCTPTPSVVELQNSSRVGQGRNMPQLEHNSTNTRDRTHQQVRFISLLPVSVCISFPLSPPEPGPHMIILKCSSMIFFPLKYYDPVLRCMIILGEIYFFQNIQT